MRGGEAPKIVQIETRYVETDAVNFRDVVQSLTGKNSSTDWIGSASHQPNQLHKQPPLIAAPTTNKPPQTIHNSMPSFKDFDALLPWF
ncbi:uncharacterized protein DS421_10g287230 [Arachis hypogaea]|nr:uncharacterized protein DS421_10g287230 [Arachis hypogaea]